MRAVVVDQGRLDYVERPDPVPGDTELLVAVKTAGLNGADLLQRRGGYPAPPGSPADIPGLEFAGEVLTAGRQVTRFVPGDLVMGVVGGGGQATMAVIDETHALAVPAGCDWPAAGGFPEVFSTAFDALFTQAALGPGERLLVTGAAGGVGTAAVQLGAVAGATVVASVRRGEAHQRIAGLGAAEVVDPKATGDHGPYDVVLELVGGPSLAENLPFVATGARVVVIGVGAGATVELNLHLLMGRRARLSASTLRARDRPGKAAVAAAVTAHVLPLLATGRISVPVAATYPLAEAERAYEAFSNSGKVGKIVLVA